jgi:KaiC/GvpD/RAD55 family RecA-like ATPase
MFPEIHSALRLDKYSVENKRINIVQEPSTDASFLLHHFTSVASKSNCNILIIAFEQTIGHFHGVGMKLGYDLLKLQKKGQVIFFDALKNAHNSYISDSNCSDTENIFDFHSDLATTLIRLLNVIEQKITQFENKARPLVVIIDKLSLLLSLGAKLSNVVNFLIHLQISVKDKNGTLGKIQKQL